jgi:hypothetical protein
MRLLQKLNQHANVLKPGLLGDIKHSQFSTTLLSILAINCTNVQVNPSATLVST